MAEIKFGPYEPDIFSVGSSKSSHVNNVVPTVNGYGPLAEINEFTGVLTGACRGIAGMVQSDGSSALFAGNDADLYRLNGTTRAWNNVSKSAAAYNVNARQLWDYCQFGNEVIAVTSGNPVQSYVLGTSALFADLAGSPPQARRCSVVGDFVVLGGLTANPNRVHWSGINNTTQWTAGSNQSDFQDFPDGGNVQGVAGGEFGIVFQDRAIRRMIYSGPPNIFEFQRISDNKGVVMRYSICRTGGSTFFLSSDGFYKIELSGQMTPIGENRVNRTFLGEADFSDHRFMIGVVDPFNPLVFWFYKSLASSAANTLDKVLIYNWALDRFSRASMMTIAATPMLQFSATLEGLDAVGNLDALPFSLDTYESNLAQRLGVMGADMKLGFLDGSALEATLDTPEGAVGNGARTLVRDVAPIGDASGAMISVRYRDRLIDSLAATTETAIGVRGYAPVRVNARFNTVRARVPAATNWSYLRGVDVDGRVGGRR